MSRLLNDVIEIAKIYYRIPGNESGGVLHIVLDDGNVTDDDIILCMTSALKECDHLAVDLCYLILKLNYNDRVKLVMNYDAYCVHKQKTPAKPG